MLHLATIMYLLEDVGVGCTPLLIVPCTYRIFPPLRSKELLSLAREKHLNMTGEDDANLRLFVREPRRPGTFRTFPETIYALSLSSDHGDNLQALL